jgi:hypothetical protein
VTGLCAINILTFKFLFSTGIYSLSIGIYFPLKALLYKDLLNNKAVQYDESKQIKDGIYKLNEFVVSSIITINE